MLLTVNHLGMRALLKNSFSELAKEFLSVGQEAAVPPCK